MLSEWISVVFSFMSPYCSRARESNYSDAFVKIFPVCIDGQVVVGEQFFQSLCVLYRSKTNWRGIKNIGFTSRRGDSCMIVYMSPLRYKSSFFLYSPTILLEKNVELSITFLSSKSEVNQHLASHKISNLT